MKEDSDTIKLVQALINHYHTQGETSIFDNFLLYPIIKMDHSDNL